MFLLFCIIDISSVHPYDMGCLGFLPKRKTKNIAMSNAICVRHMCKILCPRGFRLPKKKPLIYRSIFECIITNPTYFWFMPILQDPCFLTFQQTSTAIHIQMPSFCLFYVFLYLVWHHNHQGRSRRILIINREIYISIWHILQNRQRHTP